MAYEIKCSNCGQLIEFGGRESLERLPDHAIRFDGEVYCKKCVKEFVQFGTGDMRSEVDKLKSMMEDMAYELGMDFDLD